MLKKAQVLNKFGHFGPMCKRPTDRRMKEPRLRKVCIIILLATLAISLATMQLRRISRPKEDPSLHSILYSSRVQCTQYSSFYIAHTIYRKYGAFQLWYTTYHCIAYNIATYTVVSALFLKIQMFKYFLSELRQIRRWREIYVVGIKLIKIQKVFCEKLL